MHIISLETLEETDEFLLAFSSLTCCVVGWEIKNCFNGASRGEVSNRYFCSIIETHDVKWWWYCNAGYFKMYVGAAIDSRCFKISSDKILRVASSVHWTCNINNVFENTKEAPGECLEIYWISQVVRSFSAFAVSHRKQFAWDSNMEELKESRDFTCWVS